MAQIAYLADLLAKAEAKYVKASSKPNNEVKLMKQIAYLTELLSHSDSKAAPPSDNEAKLLKEIDYLTDLIQKQRTTLDDSKYINEISYLTELLKKASEIDHKVAVLQRQSSGRSNGGDDTKYLHQIQYLVKLLETSDKNLAKEEKISAKKQDQIAFMTKLLA
jgi:hypothetical protein